MKKLFDIITPPRHLAAFLLAASIGILSVAYISQYVFHYDPCPLCLYQRVPYFVVIVFSLVAILHNQPVVQRWLLKLCALTFAAGAGLALFHTGVEQGWWQGLQSCGDSALPAAGDVEALRAYLLNRQIVRCDVPIWQLFGLSMTVYNLMASVVLAVLTAGLLKRDHGWRG